MYVGPIFADSRGRIWVGVYNLVDMVNSKSVALFDGDGWEFFGSAETGGKLTGSVSAFAETSDGAVWMVMGMNSVVAYQNGAWTSVSGFNGIGSPIVLDARNNLWYNNNGLTVHWGGLDHPFTDGQWLSATRFQASYSFDANILPGVYTVNVDGALDADGMAADASSHSSFQVAFSAGVTPDPPAPPQVVAQTNGSLNHLAASWQATSPHIDQYRYAIGTTPGTRDVVGWTYVAGTSFERNDLNLVKGRTYYVTVQARNTSGLWSIDSAASSVVIGQSNLYLPSVRR